MLNDLFNLKGRTAVVTGGSKGIGEAVARGFAEAGANVILTARSEDALKTLAADISSGTDARVAYRVCDMTDRSSVDAMTQSVLDEFGHADILFNNAGDNMPQPLVETVDDDWDRILELNFTSCMRLARAFAPGMIEQQWGRIIHVSSIMALTGAIGRGIYSGTKAALLGMTRAHALELGPHGITVNCLAPGPVLTDLPRAMLSVDQQAAFGELAVLKRWGTVEDMVGPALLLASDAGAYMSGTMLVVDGGVLCRSF